MEPAYSHVIFSGRGCFSETFNVLPEADFRTAPAAPGLIWSGLVRSVNDLEWATELVQFRQFQAITSHFTKIPFQHCFIIATYHWTHLWAVLNSNISFDLGPHRHIPPVPGRAGIKQTSPTSPPCPRIVSWFPLYKLISSLPLALLFSIRSVPIFQVGRGEIKRRNYEK